MNIRFLPHLALLMFVTLAACDTPTPPKATAVEESTPARAETKGIEAASLVGYDGKQARKTVDKALNGSDQHNAQLDQTLKDSNNQ